VSPLPLASVVVLNFNGEQIITRCLDCLLAQTYPRLQLIVVDNASTDRSLEILTGYESRGQITLVRSAKNRGCPGGRNLGLAAATGEVVAFMDNDGYARPTWLAEAVQVLAADENVGAVASLVFFNRHPLILNGAGGTLNRRGYGGDYCFKEPYEFARLPNHVLYPMGCGMVVRRAVLERMGDFDEQLFNYYDDAEVGFWAWRMGLQVVLAPDAWVDHDFGASDEINRNKLLLCERNRIRTVLKYFPAAQLPSWLLREALSLLHVRPAWLWALPFRAWGWNVAHLPSTLRRRRRYGGAPAALQRLVFPTWGTFPPPRPNNHLNRPDTAQLSTGLAFDGAREIPQLNFGWYQLERHGSAAMRWTTGIASAFLRVPTGAREAVVTWLAARPGQLTGLRLRPLGETGAVWQTADAPAPHWQTRRYRCALAPGLYELQLETAPVHVDAGGRELGIAVASVTID
jgi:N-acetylglucosaminyl-diphospho-decaprenol L-rhamnosyltransferase